MNEYTDADGVQYVAKDASLLQYSKLPACKGCAFWPSGDFDNCEKSKCCAEDRADKRSIIWVKSA